MHRRSQGSDRLLFDPKIEATTRKLNAVRRKKKKRRQVIMGEPVERTLKDFTEPTYGSTSSITRPAIEPTSFELKTNLATFVQQDQFSGSLTENPLT